MVAVQKCIYRHRIEIKSDIEVSLLCMNLGVCRAVRIELVIVRLLYRVSYQVSTDTVSIANYRVVKKNKRTPGSAYKSVLCSITVV